MKKIVSYLSLVIITFVSAVVLAACQQQSENTTDNQEGLNIVTSFYPIYAMTKAVSGDLNNVRMIQSGNGIHSFEPSPNDVAAIYDADVFIFHSHTLEAWAGDIKENLKDSQEKVLEASEKMSLDKVKGLEDMEAGDGIDPATLYDPHTWTDPELAAEEVEHIKEMLISADPDNKETYEKNAEAFKKEAQEITKEYQKKFESVKNKTFVTQHTAFSYLAKRFGLTQLGIAGISPDQEPQPRQLIEIREFIKDNNVKTIFVEANVSQKIAETVAESTGAKLKTLSPLEADPENNKNYLENVKDNLEILYQELSK
ncbi:metal ABC transporter solute-binding protein, Zn/Mn family [Streptococcus zalophi]|uniref:Zinc ABC transporter substrate-binding protein n=1 Tax=Streptococcus zalophi TaxID=640031 RepID=A0A934PAZ0_9STRE|nr:zinc ABC transporter substrate-binding protein [Streptococcus zalophi]MBJ8350224.1 zinc ABC transporter substrate-binding protein [Streptococcus zalophi]MCR8967536.1 zinc ABC transporter substrate-binding protein [Streptococcus zalophi]